MVGSERAGYVVQRTGCHTQASHFVVFAHIVQHEPKSATFGTVRVMVPSCMSMPMWTTSEQTGGDGGDGGDRAGGGDGGVCATRRAVRPSILLTRCLRGISDCVSRISAGRSATPALAPRPFGASASGGARPAF